MLIRTYLGNRKRTATRPVKCRNCGKSLRPKTKHDICNRGRRK